ncbi:unnamed protein product [Spirodela intermedia]|uniref:Uncharacterized protein n=1 Tax=Spirodela intermedia TaxID=51605 RepID=A0A7I8IE16_SPIIN|nr:unnamed protein product [Spirodela intermedia]CAA6655634.1 unnamed protein product [Spirodela intermedia]
MATKLELSLNSRVGSQLRGEVESTSQNEEDFRRIEITLRSHRPTERRSLWMKPGAIIVSTDGQFRPSLSSSA